MKKILNGIKDLVLRHKLLSIICFLTLIVIIIMTYVFLNLFVVGTNKYGTRLAGIEKVKITEKDQKEVESFLTEKEEVNEADVRIQGKIIYISINYTNTTSLDRAKEIASEVLEKFSDSEKKFYDIGYFLTRDKLEDSEDVGFVVTGSKNSKLDTISWIKS